MWCVCVWGGLKQLTDGVQAPCLLMFLSIKQNTKSLSMPCQKYDLSSGLYLNNIQFLLIVCLQINPFIKEGHPRLPLTNFYWLYLPNHKICDIALLYGLWKQNNRIPKFRHRSRKWQRLNVLSLLGRSGIICNATNLSFLSRRISSLARYAAFLLNGWTTFSGALPFFCAFGWKKTSLFSWWLL